MRSRSRRRYSWGFEAFHAQPTVSQQRSRATAATARLKKKGDALDPVLPITGAIAKTFWGKAWCDHLERFSDYSNRLPRGRTYVRSGTVVDLRIEEGKVRARVQGTRLYEVEVTIRPVAAPRWKKLVKACSGSIASLVDLLSGSLPKSVIEKVTDRGEGLFPATSEISFACSCPDWASMCKHVAATLYGVGARLDDRPELLFVLRGADHHALVAESATRVVDQATAAPVTAKLLDADALGDVFGIALDGPAVAPAAILPSRAAAKTTKAARETAVAAKTKASRAAAVAAKTKAAAPSSKPKSTPAKRGATPKAKSSVRGASRGAFDGLDDYLRDCLRDAFTR